MTDSAMTNGWFSQERVPIEQRFLWIDGHVSPIILERILKGLPQRRTDNTATLFVGFAFADIEIGHYFDVIFPKRNPEEGRLCQSRIVAVTQQWGNPFDRVAHGWKTICELEFPDGIPSLIHHLPEVEGWNMNAGRVCISNVATWETIKEQAPKAV
jgi:hypothetical protein